MIHIILLPSADTGDCSDGVTVTLNGKADVPLRSSRVTGTNPEASNPLYCLDANLTLISTNKVHKYINW